MKRKKKPPLMTICVLDAKALACLRLSNQFPRSPIMDPELSEVLLSRGHSFCIKDRRGSIIGAGGVIPLWRGVGEVWLAATDEMKKYPITMTKACRRLLDDLRSGFHRIQMTALKSEPGHVKWAKLLGFHEEGLMTRYGPDGEDHFRLAKTWQ